MNNQTNSRNNNESNNNESDNGNENANTDERIITEETIRIANEQFEVSILNWLRFIFMIFTTAIALINFTKISRLYAILMFIIGLFLLILRIVDYFVERNRLVTMGVNIRFRIDTLMLSMIPVCVFIFYILFKL